MGQKPKSELKEIELNNFRHSICLKKGAFQKRTSTLDEKLPIYDHLMFTHKSGIWFILCQLMDILAKRFEIWTSNLFCPSFTLTLM